MCSLSCWPTDVKCQLLLLHGCAKSGRCKIDSEDYRVPALKGLASGLQGQRHGGGVGRSDTKNKLEL